MALRDEDGNVVEDVVPKAEAEEQAKKAAETARAEVAQEKSKLEEQLKKANEDLAALNSGDKNWQDARIKREELETKLNEVTKRLDEQETQKATRLSTAKSGMFLQLADGNQEEADKIKIFYEKQTAGSEDTEEDIRIRVNNAYTLYKSAANRQAQAGALNGDVISNAGGGGVPNGKKAVALTPEGQGLASKLGVTPDKVKKFNDKRKGQ